MKLSGPGSWDEQDEFGLMPSARRLVDYITRVVGGLMIAATVLFALYLVVEVFQPGGIKNMVLIRAVGTVVLVLCALVWFRARGQRQALRAGIAGLTFSTTISICTTLATHYSDSTFEIALAYGLMIAVLNVLLWRSAKTLWPGIIGAILPPLILMGIQRPPVDTVVDYVALTVVTIILTFVVFVVQQAVLNEVVTLHEELVGEVGRDDLTGMMNRRRWSERVTNWEERNAGAAYIVLYLDLDRFKYVNDRYGHDAGDQALRSFAQVLQQAVPAKGIAARFGGDEFVVFLPGNDGNADRFLVQLGIDVADSELATYGLQVSSGRAAGQVGVSQGDLLREADFALLASKRRHQQGPVIEVVFPSRSPASGGPLLSTRPAM